MALARASGRKASCGREGEPRVVLAKHGFQRQGGLEQSKPIQVVGKALGTRVRPRGVVDGREGGAARVMTHKYRGSQ
jgi:hypothetical protein